MRPVWSRDRDIVVVCHHRPEGDQFQIFADVAAPLRIISVHNNGDLANRDVFLAWREQLLGKITELRYLGTDNGRAAAQHLTNLISQAAEEHGHLNEQS